MAVTAAETEHETRIPVCEPVLDGRERAYVLDCLDGNWISSLGDYIPRFEHAFSTYCGAAHGVACSSGTAALHLALESLHIGPGDEVIIPAFTLIVSANVVTMTGATPVLVDVEPDTWCIDPARIEEKITPATKAIMVVHMYGHPADMDAVMAIARRRDLKVVEDCAQAHGAAVHGRRVGAIGHVGAFSFYGNKILTTGEGGMVVTNDAQVAERAALLRNQAFEAERFVHRAVGFNYRMTNIQAAIGLAQCARLDDRIGRKIDIARTYRRLLGCAGAAEARASAVAPAAGDTPGATPPAPASDGACPDIQPQAARPWATPVYWMFGVVLAPTFGTPAADVRRMLAERGIDTRAFFVPMNRQPIYDGKDPRTPDLRGDYPVADDLAVRGLYLPSGAAITHAQQERVVRCLLACRRSA